MPDNDRERIAIRDTVLGFFRGGQAKPAGEPAVAAEQPDASVHHAAILAALPDPAILVDAQLRIRSLNAAAVDLLGPQDEGTPITFAIRAPQLAEALRNVLAGAPPVRVTYYEKVPVDRWLEAHVAPIPRARHDAGAPDLLIALRDLTGQQRIERMRSDFIANASHELRTPLASVIGFIETLQGPARNDPAARDRFLEIMASQASRMARLIEDLMSLSRIEQKAHVRPGKTIDLVATVRHVMDALLPIAIENSVELVDELGPAGDVVMVTGDTDELTQVFQNLIENAIRYGKSGGQVEVSARRVTAAGQPERVEVQVRDFGPGIAPEHLPRLTERFYRADVTTSRERGGTGLGLAIVKHILNRHRGSLNVESTVGKGAVFTVRLDVSKHPEGAEGKGSIEGKAL